MKWKKEVYGNSEIEIKKLHSSLFLFDNFGPFDKGTYLHTHAQLDQSFKYKCIWREYSKIQWIRKGDRNTIFFMYRFILKIYK